MYIPELVLQAADKMFFLTFLTALIGSFLGLCTASMHVFGALKNQSRWQETAENVHRLSTSLFITGWIFTALLFLIANKKTEIGELSALRAMSGVLAHQANLMWYGFLGSILVYTICLLMQSGWGKSFASKTVRKMLGWIVALVLFSSVLCI